MDKDSTAMGDADIKGLASRAAPPILKAERAQLWRWYPWTQPPYWKQNLSPAGVADPREGPLAARDVAQQTAAADCLLMVSPLPRYAIVDHHKIYDARPLGSSQVLFALVSA